MEVNPSNLAIVQYMAIWLFSISWESTQGQCLTRRLLGKWSQSTLPVDRGLSLNAFSIYEVKRDKSKRQYVDMLQKDISSLHFSVKNKR